MLYKALKSFGGKVSMKKGETKEINDINFVKDLLNVGYIEEVITVTPTIAPTVTPIVEQVDAEVKEEIKKTKTTRKKK